MIAETRTTSDFLIRAENLHKQAELAWFEGRNDDVTRYCEESRELMERYYSSLDVPKQEIPEPPPIEILRIPRPQPRFEQVMIFILSFLAGCGLVTFLSIKTGGWLR